MVTGGIISTLRTAIDHVDVIDASAYSRERRRIATARQPAGHQVPSPNAEHEQEYCNEPRY
jgi:hypothetical protein